MNLAELLAKEAVLTSLAATSRKGVLQELVAPVVELHPELVRHDIVEALCQREEMGSTAMGEGVALPHCKIPGLEKILIAAGRSRTGIAFGQTPDSELCNIFLLILAPETEAGLYLRVLAQLARRAKDPSFRSDLLLSETREQMWQVITSP